MVDLVCAVIVVVGVVVGIVVQIIGSFVVTDVVVITEAKEGVVKGVKGVDDAIEEKVEGCVASASNEWEGPTNEVVIAVDVSVIIGIETVTDGKEVAVDVISDPDDSIVSDSDPAVGSPRNLKALKRKVNFDRRKWEC